MKEFLPFLVFGVTAGAVYGISAMGLVLTYKTSGLFNFGHGAVSAMAAFLFYTLHVEHGLAWPVAALVAVLGFGVVAGLVLERVAAALAEVAITYKIVGTIGLLVGIRAVIVLIYGEEARVFAPFLPQTTVFSIQGVSVSIENLITLGLGVAAAVGLFLLFRVTRLGLAVRAVVDDAALLDVTGENPTRVRRYAWILGSVFATASGVLFASVQQQVQVDVLALLIVQAFGAAALARFTSLPGSFAGGLVIGMAQALISKEATRVPALVGLDLNIPFLVLFVVLLVIPKGRLVDLGRQVKARATPPSRLSVRSRRVVWALSLAVAAVLPHVVGARLALWNTAMSQVVLFLSLGLLVRLSGQISLCHVGFAAAGAAAFGHLLSWGLPWPVALMLAGIGTVPVGLLIAVPAIRLSGLYLGLATLGFGIFLAQFFYTKSYFFGVGQQLATPRPAGFTSDVRYYYVLLALALAGALIVVVVERSRLGRLLRGLADAPVALSTLGANTNVSLVLVFCLSAAMAGVSGAAFAGLFGRVGGFSFPATQSLTLLAVLVVAGPRIVPAAFLAPVLLFVVPGYAGNPHIADGLQIAFGLTAVLVAVASQGSVDAWFARRALQARERLVGPASRGVNVLRSRPARTATAGLTADAVGGGR
jgi:branched-subunit amino acid ABC-type transport system permease component